MRLFFYAAPLFVPALLLLPGPAAAAPQDDSFGDGVRGPQWSLIEDNPAHLSLAEQNGRLEVLATGSSAASDDALYLSNGPSGFRLSTAEDFRVEIDYSFTDYVNESSFLDSMLLVLGVGRDPEGTDAAAVAFGYGNAGTGIASGLGVGTRTDGTETTDTLGPGSPTGTFVVDYAAGTDTLTLGDGTLSHEITDTVRGLWEADDLLVSFGARGTGFATSSGDAFFDDFRIVSGTIVPEPAFAALFATASLLLRRRSMA